MPTQRAPLNALELAYVHGARTHDTRASLHRSASGELVYPTAALVVLLSSPLKAASSATPTQRFYRKHRSAVLSVARHPNGAIFASGALGASRRPLLRRTTLA